VVATRARWRVDAKLSKSRGKDFVLELGLQDSERLGEVVNTETGDGGTRTGKAVVGGCEEERVDEDEDVVGGGGAEGILRGRPDAARALTTASQPASRVLILSLSSSFSTSLALSFSLCSSIRSSSARRSPMSPMPALSCRFSSSSSATRCSRYAN